MRKLLFIIIISLLGLNLGIAQQVFVGDSSLVDTDTSYVDTIPTLKMDVKKYQSDKAFDYVEKEIPATNNWWTRFWKAIWQWFDDMMALVFQNNATGWVIRFFLFSVLLGFVYYFFISGKSAVFSKNDVALKLTAENVDIHEIDFEKEIQLSENQQQYIEAVRWRYLELLKLLSDKQLISWQIDKTNSSYVQELILTNMYQDFAHITLIFESVFYGQKELDVVEWQSIKQIFEQFKSDVKA